MRKFFCDICGTQLSDERVKAILDKQEESLCEEHMVNHSSAALSACPSVKDLCEGCEEAGKNIDVEGMILAEWGRLVRKYGEKKAGGRRTRKKKGVPTEEPPSAPTNHPEAPGPEAAKLEGQKTEESEKPEKPDEAKPGEKKGTGRAAGQVPMTISADSVGKQGPGSHWAKKKYIHAQLMQYRKQTGLGTLPKLSQLSGVPTETIRLMIESKPVEIEKWRQLGAALDKLGIVPPESEQTT